MKLFPILILASLAGVQAPRPVGYPCRCEAVRQSDGWCRRCKVGYLAGVKVASPKFFDALDTHGHKIDPARVLCATCRKNYDSDGYCPSCRYGFVNKQAWFSRLSYYLARAPVQPADSIACATCLKNTHSSGWCEACNRGMVGFHAYNNHAEFDQAARMRELLMVAVDVADQCLTCALAIINDAECITCRVRYLNGKKLPIEVPR